MQGGARFGDWSTLTLYTAAWPACEAKFIPESWGREYWIVDPENKTVRVMLLAGDAFQPHEIYKEDDIAKVNVLEGCFVELNKMFAE